MWFFGLGYWGMERNVCTPLKTAIEMEYSQEHSTMRLVIPNPPPTHSVILGRSRLLSRFPFPRQENAEIGFILCFQSSREGFVSWWVRKETGDRWSLVVTLCCMRLHCLPAYLWSPAQIFRFLRWHYSDLLDRSTGVFSIHPSAYGTVSIWG